MALLAQAREQFVEQHELARGRDEVVAERRERAVLDVGEEVRVVAALAQLHHHVQQARAVAAAVHDFDVLLQRLLVELLLHLGHAHLQDHLLLRGERLLHLRLEPAQQERPEHLVQLLRVPRHRPARRPARPEWPLPEVEEHIRALALPDERAELEHELNMQTQRVQDLRAEFDREKAIIESDRDSLEEALDALRRRLPRLEEEHHDSEESLYMEIEKLEEKLSAMISARDELEADLTVQQLKDANPQKEYKVEEVAVYDSDAFRYGRDPELH